MGTTSLKVSAFDQDGRVLCRAESNLKSNTNGPGYFEQDPYDVYDTVIAEMVHVTQAVRSKGYQIHLVGFSAAMHSIMAIDEDNLPLTSAITWMDGRADKEAEELWEASGRQIYWQTGTPIHPMSPLVKIAWLRKHQPDLFRRVRRFVSLKEWVWYQWFHEWAIDESLASATGLLDIRKRDWSRDALVYAGIRKEQLSQIVPTSYGRTGCLDSRLTEAGLGAEATFNIGASDGVLANLGVGAIDAQTAVISMGTSLAVRMVSPEPLTNRGDPVTVGGLF